MAETFLFEIAAVALRKIAALSVNEIVLAWGVESELSRLENTVSAIRSVLLDADEQRLKKQQVNDWLEKLNDVLYDVDDLLDDIATEALRWKVEIGQSKRKEVGNFFSRSNPLAFRFTMSHKIKKIRERLDDIDADRRSFHFVEQVIDTQVANRVRETHSFVCASDVIGRVGDKVKIVELLLRLDCPEDISVVPIVGLGGLGKTTLAKLVYNDERVVGKFEARMWVCVSEDFELKKVTEKIIKSANCASNVQLDLDQLQTCLRRHLNSKKFLLVLDDVWNEDPKKWKDLRELLSGGAKGSKILVTTRSGTVASIMGTIPPYNLKGLSNDECFSIFVKCAFKEGQEKEHPKLVEIGKVIVSKCGGIPLAVRTLGSLLYMKTEEREWLYIKDNDMWKIAQKENDILPILRLSYDQMPSHLKQCFAYCCNFPKDYLIPREELINLWIAQGFIQPADGSLQLEDIGNLYFRDLLSRSFFHDVDETFDSEILTCKMHDLVHDLARSVAGKEFSIMNCETKVISERVRHGLFCEENLSGKEFPRSLRELEKMRSFSFSFKIGPISKSFLDALIKSFKCLRVLDLSESEFEELPNSIGTLNHLRYLGLCQNRCIRELPNSICKLLNMQTLYLFGCEQLQDLPKDIDKLGSLRHLYLTSQLTCLPEKALEGLTSLQSLSILQCHRLESLSEGMQHLTALRSLHISQCPRLASFPNSIKCLTALEKLWIWDCELFSLNFPGEESTGLRSIQSLLIWGLPNLVVLPDELQNAATSLQYLLIQDCPSLKDLPKWLARCANLLKLEVVNCPILDYLPEGMNQLTALRVLCLKGCPGLSKRYGNNRRVWWSDISHIPEIYIDSDKEVSSFIRHEMDDVAPWAPWFDLIPDRYKR
uniref:Putative disease resistance protein RGA1 n=1 Tax=Davidia involucrata TaxID=16924 RepID=A0A5B7AAH7_DAVIN